MKKVNVTKKEKSVLQGKLTRLAVQIGKAGEESTQAHEHAHAYTNTHYIISCCIVLCCIYLFTYLNMDFKSKHIQVSPLKYM